MGRCRAGLKSQVRLPLRKAAEIAGRSLRVRMGRSLLTLATIVMAIAFLSYIWMTRTAVAAMAPGTGNGVGGGGARGRRE